MSEEKYKFYFKSIDPITLRHVYEMIPYRYQRIGHGNGNATIIVYTTYDNMISLYIDIQEYLGYHFDVKRLN